MATWEDLGDAPSAHGPGEKYSSEQSNGAWEEQFLDDLVAANRFKNYLVTQGIDLPEGVLEGLAKLSARFRSEMNAFVELERKRLRRRSFFPALFTRFVEIERP